MADLVAASIADGLAPEPETQGYEQVNLLIPTYGIEKESAQLLNGWRYYVQPGDTVQSIAAMHRVSANQLRQTNNLEDDFLKAGQTLVLPDQNAVFQPPQLGATSWPFTQDGWEYQISQTYRPGHGGVDFAVAAGIPIRAVSGGTVTAAGRDINGYGNTVVVHHGQNFYTLYAHLSEISVSRGEKVFKGEPLGYSGNTGKSTNPHLHFEIRDGFRQLDPCHYLIGGC
ncbi:MAG: LysM peptidoglycan-binding domain-containing M23 family metallopeptidase [Chloroflexota bacterium]